MFYRFVLPSKLVPKRHHFGVTRKWYQKDIILDDEQTWGARFTALVAGIPASGCNFLFIRFSTQNEKCINILIKYSVDTHFIHYIKKARKRIRKVFFMMRPGPQPYALAAAGAPRAAHPLKTSCLTYPMGVPILMIHAGPNPSPTQTHSWPNWWHH